MFVFCSLRVKTLIIYSSINVAQLSIASIIAIDEVPRCPLILLYPRLPPRRRRVHSYSFGCDPHNPIIPEFTNSLLRDRGYLEFRPVGLPIVPMQWIRAMNS
ncbi:hypothetical protein Lqua_1312 [Legionella quateirensis]|uniref:Uncharacterized protein n=1 Tax=Legionella quateirensis TaxID=45072 RepID=A0ABR5RQI0_9GAMM|nr:hypothetical protein Lqua_1312 [Legionella quateirensis]